jgi:hypothetical protein
MEEISVMEVEETSDTKKNKRNYKGGQQKDKGKQPMGTSRRLKTRPTNKFRLNTKALFDPSLKTGKPIVIEDDISEGTPGDTSRERNNQEDT